MFQARLSSRRLVSKRTPKSLSQQLRAPCISRCALSAAAAHPLCMYCTFQEMGPSTDNHRPCFAAVAL